MAISRKRSRTSNYKRTYAKRKNPFNAFSGKRRKIIKKPRIGHRGLKRIMFPLTQIVEFKLTEEITLTPGSGTSDEDKTTHMAQVCDPFNHDDNTHQCNQWDAAVGASGPYQLATVMSSTANIRRLNTTGTAQTPGYWSAYLQDQTDEKFQTSSVSLATIQGEDGLAKPNYAKGLNDGHPGFNKGNFKKVTYNCKKFFKEKNPYSKVSDDLYACGPNFDSATNGSEIAKPVCYIYAVGAVGVTPTPMRFLVTVTYKVLLHDRIKANSLES